MTPFAGQIKDFFSVICHEFQGGDCSDGNDMGPETDEMPGLVCLWMKWDRVRHSLGRLGEVSPNFDQRTGVRRWGQKTVCKAWL